MCNKHEIVSFFFFTWMQKYVLTNCKNIGWRVAQNSIFWPRFRKVLHWFKRYIYYMYCLFSAASQAKDLKHNLTITYFGCGTFLDTNKKLVLIAITQKELTDSGFSCCYSEYSLSN